MADIPPSNPVPPPGGVVQPPKKETGKVQPKKETVRISLPPKPTAAPTIKLPTLPPGGPTGVPGPAPASAPAIPALAKAAPAAAAASPAAGRPGIAPAAGTPRPAAPRSAAPVVPTIKTMDKALIYCAAVFGLIGTGMVGFVFYKLNDIVTSFTS